MPTLGRRLDTLQQALDSVAAQRVPTRLVVVVPEDAEEARSRALEAGATVIDDPGRGLSAAVNAGILAEGDETYFAWLNDDDYFLPGGLPTLLSLLSGAPDAVVAYGGCRYITEDEGVLGSSRAGRVAWRILPWGPSLIPQPASLIRLATAREAGGYDEALRYSMDLDMFLRLRRCGAFVATREEVATFRWHGDSISVAQRPLAVREAQQVKRRYLPPAARRIAPLWDVPVRSATDRAGRLVSRRARRLAREERV